MNNEKINEIKSLNQYFPKGDKRRGEALVLVSEAFLLGKTTAQKKKRQGMNVTIEQLRTLADDLEEEIKDNLDKYEVSGYGTKFQINIINPQEECSDTWEIEDVEDN